MLLQKLVINYRNILHNCFQLQAANQNNQREIARRYERQIASLNASLGQMRRQPPRVRHVHHRGGGGGGGGCVLS